MLANSQRDLAGQLGRRSKTHPDKFRGVATESGVTGCPLLLDALGYLECRVRGEHPPGDTRSSSARWWRPAYGGRARR
ncbi:MAG: flavin reductase [Dehalococcoidia bacterium]